jgi:hypothetical protein
MARSATGIAHARAGLLGNPSDQYGGKTIAFSIRDFAARVSIESSDRLVIRPGPSDLVEFASFLEARDTAKRKAPPWPGELEKETSIFNHQGVSNTTPRRGHSKP